MVCTSPIAQHIGHPRNATRPTGRSSRLTQPMTGVSAIEAAMDPSPTAPRARCVGTDLLANYGAAAMVCFVDAVSAIVGPAWLRVVPGVLFIGGDPPLGRCPGDHAADECVAAAEVAGRLCRRARCRARACVDGLGKFL